MAILSSEELEEDARFEDAKVFRMIDLDVRLRADQGLEIEIALCTDAHCNMGVGESQETLP